MSTTVREIDAEMVPSGTGRPVLHRRIVMTLEILGALLLAIEVVLLLTAVVARYFLNSPIIWIDELASFVFLWLTMLGAVLALERNEHLRLTLVINKIHERHADLVRTCGLFVIAAFLIRILPASYEFMLDEWYITTPTLGIKSSFRVAAVFVGNLLMVGLLVLHILEHSRLRHILIAVSLLVAAVALMWIGQPLFRDVGNLSILIFLVGIVGACLAGGVPIAFCFGAATVAFLTFTTNVPMMVVIGRMDEGMSSLILLSVPIFFLLGCILDSTGMGKAIVDFLAALIGHVRAGMSYVLLGSMFLVSGISGAKASDMATVAPALFPEMKRRGNKPSEMIALLATGAAMADTVPPSIVLIVIASVASVSVAALFTSGVVIAAVLLVVLMIAARLRFSNEDIQGVKRVPWRTVAKIALVASPALLLPFLIRGAVTEGVATATEVSTLAVVYAAVVGHVMYGGISLRRAYAILVDTVTLTGAIMLIMGTASAMAWALTQTGFAAQLGQFMKNLPGGWVTFMGITVLVFLVLGSILEGIPAIVLMGPLMFSIAKSLGINDVHYAMVVVVAMNIGLMAPPLGIGYYLACSIGKVPPDEAMAGIWPYLLALLLGLVPIVLIPGLSIGLL